MLTLIVLVDGDLFGGVLHLQEQFDALDGGHERVGNGGRYATCHQILDERRGIQRRRRPPLSDHVGHSSGSTHTRGSIEPGECVGLRAHLDCVQSMNHQGVVLL